MAWAGTGVIWTITGGVPTSKLLAAEAKASKDDFTFVQISDSHIGFNRPANTDATGTMQAAIDKINALTKQPEFIIHTGDLTHQSKPAEFDGMDQVLKSVRSKEVFYVPGEHDTSVDDGKAYLERYGKNTQGKGWYSFDHKVCTL
jgi:predicted MPP superfamily phosphohydrolase